MKLFILAVGNRMPAWIDEGLAEYAKRMPAEAKVQLREIKPERRESGKSVSQIQAIEAAKISAAIAPGSLKVVLDEKGKLFSTAEFAQSMKGWMQSGKDVSFIIGGADGTHPDLKNSADLLLSLSPLTMPHGLARVVLAEQLYRTVSFINNHPYHREG